MPEQVFELVYLMPAGHRDQKRGDPDLLARPSSLMENPESWAGRS